MLPSSSRSAPEASSTSSICAAAFSSRSAVVKRPSTTARSAPERTRLASARAPPSRCSPVTTMVLPVPVSPVSTVRPRSNSAVATLMAPNDSIRISLSTGQHRHRPRQPVTGRRNLRTRRSVNGALSSRAHFTDTSQRRTSNRAPAGTSISRRPSQNNRASCPSPSISMAMRSVGAGDHRAGEQRVSVVGYHQQRFQIGPQHGPARGERVGRGPGGC